MSHASTLTKYYIIRFSSTVMLEDVRALLPANEILEKDEKRYCHTCIVAADDYISFQRLMRGHDFSYDYTMKLLPQYVADATWKIEEDLRARGRSLYSH
jgi:hypothetical protein